MCAYKLIRIVGSSIGVGILLLLCGCASIQSGAVRNLVTIQSEHVKGANDYAATLVTQTNERTDAYRKAVADLNAAFQNVQQNEAKQALIFSSNQNISTKSGVDAEAAAYMVGALYFADYAGLQTDVKAQFEADFKALETLSRKNRESWASLLKLQTELDKYSKQTGLANVDASFVSALLEQTHIDMEDIDRAIKASKQVNSVLSRAAQLKPLQGQGLERDQATVNDLIDLLGRIKAAPSK